MTESALAVASIDDPNPKSDDDDQEQQAAVEADPKSPVTRVRGLGLVRSKTYGPGVSTQHARMGSLSSPLGRIFNVDGSQAISKAGTAAGKENERVTSGGEAAKGVEARLEAIEAAVSAVLPFEGRLSLTPSLLTAGHSRRGGRQEQRAPRRESTSPHQSHGRGGAVIRRQRLRRPSAAVVVVPLEGSDTFA